MTDENQSPWVDEESSRQLPILRAQGEGQSLEFMRAFPDQARELAKEIAAFATSNSGTVLIGVDNLGDCVGLSSVSTALERDSLLRRVEGICHGTVKPSITPAARFACEAGRTVLVLTIPKGDQPIYYVHNTPYVRHMTASRPAEPHEVIELIRAAIRASPAARESVEEVQDARVQFLAGLMRNLVAVKILGEEFDDRTVNPWLDMMRAKFGDVAVHLQELAAQETAIREKLDKLLLELAESLNRVARLRLHLGSGSELTQASTAAFEKAGSLLNRVEREIIPHVSPQQLVDQLAVIQRQVRMLEANLEATQANGGIEELQTQAAELGSKILYTAHYGVDRLATGLRETLFRCGHELHLAETRRLYLDGGVSVAKLADTIRQAIATYNEAVNPIVNS